MKLLISSAMLLGMLSLTGCTQMNSRLARANSPAPSPMSIPDMSPSQNVGIAQPLPPISGSENVIASGSESLYNMPAQRLDLSVKSAESDEAEIATPVRKSTKKVTKPKAVAQADSEEKVAPKAVVTSDTPSAVAQDVDTTMLAQPVRKGSCKPSSTATRESDDDKATGSPQSNSSKPGHKNKDIVPVSNPAPAEDVDSRQFS